MVASRGGAALAHEFAVGPHDHPAAIEAGTQFVEFHGLEIHSPGPFHGIDPEAGHAERPAAGPGRFRARASQVTTASRLRLTIVSGSVAW